MKFAYIFLGLAIMLAVWVSLPVWLQAPNHAYVKDLFDHSQWRFPLSTRIISDEQLYQYAGYYLVTTGDLFTVNPEVPPLGKYLYGFSSVSIGNPYLITPLLLIAALFAFYQIGRQLELPKKTVTWLVGIVLISPLVFSQLTQTMLDLPHLTWLLLHIFFLLQIKTHESGWKRFILAILAGLFLGAFAATKVPLFVPLALLAATYYCWRKRQLVIIIPLAMATGFSYLITFLPYFLAGHTLSEWISAQKWMVDFYRQSQVKAHPLLFPISVMTGWYQGWWEQPWQRISEWSLLWPISFLAPFWVGWLAIKGKIKLSINYHYLLLLTFLFIALHFFIPFWPRYYLLLLPLCLLFWPIILQAHHFRVRPLIQVLGVLGLLVGAILFSRPSPSATLSVAIEKWNDGHYQDLYQSLQPSSRSTTAKEFHRELKKVEQVLGKPTVEISSPFTWPWQRSVPINVTVSYQTEIGRYTNQKTLVAHRVGRNWALDWDWEVVAPSFDPSDTCIFTPDYPQLGKLISKNGVILSEAGQIPTVSVVPMFVQPQPTLDRISHATGLEFNALIAQVYVDAVDELPLFIAELAQVPPETISEFSDEPGVLIESEPGRILHPELTSEAERAWAWSKIKKFPELDGELGGRIVLVKADQSTRVLLEKTAQAGQDLVINEPLPPTFSHQ